MAAGTGITKPVADVYSSMHSYASATVQAAAKLPLSAAIIKPPKLSPEVQKKILLF